MAQSGKSGTCTLVCWIVAIVLGLIAVKMTAGGVPFVFALIIGVVVALVVGFLLTRMFCTDQAVTGTVVPTKSPTQQAVEDDEAQAAQDAAREAEEEAARQAAAEAAAEAQAAMAEEEQGAADAGDAASTGEEPALVKPAQLKGQAELEARKGEWKYEGGSTEAAPKAAAPAGGADDLKQLKGVGPKLEQKLVEAGVTSFAQIAAWGPEDIAKMDDLLSFKGRITRDGWVEQAKTLAGGGETEFSKRVEDGDVY